MPSCILCKSNSLVNRQENASRTIYNCLNCGVFVVSDLVESEVKQKCAEIASFLMARKLSAAPDTVLISFEKANLDKDYLQMTVEQIVAAFPDTFEKQMRGATRNLARLSGYPGDEIKFSDLKYAPLFYLRKLNYDAFSFMIKALQKMEYIDVNFIGSSFFPCGVTLAPKGWDAVFGGGAGPGCARLLAVCPRQESDVSEVFRAVMRRLGGKLGAELTENIQLGARTDISNSLAAAVRDVGTVIADLSENSPEAYYAMAAAHSLRKNLILTCHSTRGKKHAVNTGHFPVLMWEDADALFLELLNAIKAKA